MHTFHSFYLNLYSLYFAHEFPNLFEIGVIFPFPSCVNCSGNELLEVFSGCLLVLYRSRVSMILMCVSPPSAQSAASVLLAHSLSSIEMLYSSMTSLASLPSRHRPGGRWLEFPTSTRRPTGPNGSDCSAITRCPLRASYNPPPRWLPPSVPQSNWKLHHSEEIDWLWALCFLCFRLSGCWNSGRSSIWWYVRSRI